MEELTIKMNVPEDLVNELREVPKIEWSLVMNKLLKEKLSKLIRFEKIINKSKLSEAKAFEISDEINESLAKRYDKLYKQLV